MIISRIALTTLLLVWLSVTANAAELRVALASEPTSVDPHFHNLMPNHSLARHLFDRLILSDEKQQMKPGLALSWQAINDTTWEFKLRSGVRFHDGSPFSADDVLFSFERASNVPNSPSSFGTYLKGKTVIKIDDLTVHIKTAKPSPLVPNDLSVVGIISRKNGAGASTKDYNSGRAVVGTGPYKFVDYVPGEHIVLVRNDNYWGAKPEWEKVTFKPIKFGPSRVAALLAGDVDLIADVPTVDIERLKNDPAVSLSQSISNRVIYLHLDQFRDVSPFVSGKDGSEIENPLRRREVRLAISKAINRLAIVEQVMEGMAIPAGQVLPEGFFGVSSKLRPVEYDPDGARALLTKAGLAEGFKITLHGPNDRYVNDAKISEAVAQMLTRVGIDTTVETMRRSVYFRRASAGGPNNTPEFSFILVGWGGASDASSPLKALIHTYDKERGFGASNRGRYTNLEVDALIEQALATVDEGRRQELLAQATEIAIEDGAIIPLHYQVNTWAARQGIKYKARTDEGTLADHAYSE